MLARRVTPIWNSFHMFFYVNVNIVIARQYLQIFNLCELLYYTKKSSMFTPSKPVLVVLPPSHFCEKAAWALDRYGIAYEVSVVAAGFHSGIAKQAGSKSTSTPVLILPKPQPSLCDSADIVKWAEMQRPDAKKLFPDGKVAEINELLARFDGKLGPNVRLFVYSQCLDTDEMLQGLCRGAPFTQRAAYAMGMKYIVRSFIRKGMKVNAENGAAALNECREEFKRVSDLLSDGRRYLTGDEFTAADLSFVALSAPLLGIKYGHARTFENSARPPGYQAAIEEFSVTPAGQFARRVWEDERRSVIVS